VTAVFSALMELLNAHLFKQVKSVDNNVMIELKRLCRGSSESDTLHKRL
jgi:hypothetical protein